MENKKGNFKLYTDVKREVDKLAKKLAPLPWKPMVYTTGSIIVAGVFVFCAYLLSSTFSGGFDASVFIYPLRMMMWKKAILITLLIIALAAGLIVYGVRTPRCWYMVPLGITLIAFYWLKINLSVYGAYVDKFVK